MSTLKEPLAPLEAYSQEFSEAHHEPDLELSTEGGPVVIDGFADTENERQALCLCATNFLMMMAKTGVKPDQEELRRDLWVKGIEGTTETGVPFKIQAEYHPEHGHSLKVVLEDAEDWQDTAVLSEMAKAAEEILGRLEPTIKRFRDIEASHPALYVRPEKAPSQEEESQEMAAVREEIQNAEAEQDSSMNELEVRKERVQEALVTLQAAVANRPELLAILEHLQQEL